MPFARCVSLCVFTISSMSALNSIEHALNLQNKFAFCHFHHQKQMLRRLDVPLSAFELAKFIKYEIILMKFPQRHYFGTLLHGMEKIDCEWGYRKRCEDSNNWLACPLEIFAELRMVSPLNFSTEFFVSTATRRFHCRRILNVSFYRNSGIFFSFLPFPSLFFSFLLQKHNFEMIQSIRPDLNYQSKLSIPKSNTQRGILIRRTLLDSSVGRIGSRHHRL